MMKQPIHMKIFRDQGLLRDISFLLLATGFLLHKVFDLPLESAVLYSPLVVFGTFAVLIGSAHLLLGLLALLEAIGARLGFRRGPRI
jgi:hypothetical protein